MGIPADRLIATEDGQWKKISEHKDKKGRVMEIHAPLHDAKPGYYIKSELGMWWYMKSQWVAVPPPPTIIDRELVILEFAFKKQGKVGEVMSKEKMAEELREEEGDDRTPEQAE